jgi:hypothetical protein
MTLRDMQKGPHKQNTRVDYGNDTHKEATGNPTGRKGQGVEKKHLDDLQRMSKGPQFRSHMSYGIREGKNSEGQGFKAQRFEDLQTHVKGPESPTRIHGEIGKEVGGERQASLSQRRGVGRNGSTHSSHIIHSYRSHFCPRPLAPQPSPPKRNSHASHRGNVEQGGSVEHGGRHEEVSGTEQRAFRVDCTNQGGLPGGRDDGIEPGPRRSCRRTTAGITNVGTNARRSINRGRRIPVALHNGADLPRNLGK